MTINKSENPKLPEQGEVEPQKPNKDIEIDIKEQDTVINQEEIDKAIKLAEDLDAKLDDVEKNRAEIINIISALLTAIYESGIFQSFEKIWNKIPESGQKAILGDGMWGYLMKSNNITGALTEISRDLAQAGMLETPEGITAESIAKNSKLMMSTMKWVVRIVGIIRPEAKALIPVIETTDKALNIKESILSEVRVDINASRERLRQEQEATHTKIVQTGVLAA